MNPAIAGIRRRHRMVILRYTAKLIVLAGIFLLFRLLYLTGTGELAGQLFPGAASPWLAALGALTLGLPIPLHVMAVGLIIQRRWLSPGWSKIAWLAVVVSGCWLGVVLGVKLVWL